MTDRNAPKPLPRQRTSDTSTTPDMKQKDGIDYTDLRALVQRIDRTRDNGAQKGKDE